MQPSTFTSNIIKIQKLVKAAKKQNKKIRVVGDGHSWSPIIAADDVFLVHLVSEEFKKIKPLAKGTTLRLEFY